MRDARGSVEVVVFPPDAGLMTRTPSNQTFRSQGKALSKASNVRASRASLYNAPGYQPVTVFPIPASAVNFLYQANLTRGAFQLLGDQDRLYAVGPAFLPSADAGPDHAIAGLTYQEQGVATGYLGAPVGVNWTTLAGPGTTEFSDTEPDATTVVTLPGLYTFLMTVSDGIVFVSDSVDVRFVVPNPGISPALNFPSTSFELNGLLTGATLPTSSVSDGLVSAWSVEEGASGEFSDSEKLNPTFTPDSAEGYLLRLTATGGGGMAYSDLRVIIPYAGANQLTEKITYTMAGVLSGATDPDNPVSDGCICFWSQLSGPGTSTFDDTASLNPAVTVSEAGQYIFRLSVNVGIYAVFSDVICGLTLCPTEDGSLFIYEPTAVSADVSGGDEDPNAGKQLYFGNNTFDEPPLAVAGQVGPGTLYPLGFAPEVLATINARDTVWTATCNTRFSGFSFNYLTEESVDFTVPKIVSCPPSPITVTSDDTYLSVTLFDGSLVGGAWAYKYNGLIYPAIIFAIRFTEPDFNSEITSYFANSCHKVWHGETLTCAQAATDANSAVLTFDEPNTLDAAIFECDGGSTSQVHAGGATLAFS